MAAKKKSSGWIWVLLLLLICGGVAGWFYFGKRSGDIAPEFRTSPVTKGEIIQQVTANGQITPVKSVAVGTQVSGIIKELFVDFNSRVTNGQVIARIDPSTYELNITQAEADLASARASYELAVLNQKRGKDLQKNELITNAEFDKTTVDLHQAEATMKKSEASLSKAKVDLERTTIYAPIDGIVISRAVDVGQTVAASFSTPTLFTIANDLTKMEIDAMVSEADVGGVEEGQRCNFAVDAFPNRKFRGKVIQVRFAAITNQNVVNYTTVIEVNNPDLKLRPGMTANASIITAQRSDVLRVPNAALRFRPPEGTTVRGVTNALTADASKGGSGGGEGGGSTSREEMRKRFENMSPEDREKWRERRASGGGGGGGGGRNREEATPTRTVYLMEKETVDGKEQQVLRAVTVKVGITDGLNTEITEGLKEGDVVVVGQVVTAASPARPPTGASPFGGSPFGGGGGMRPPGR